MNHSSSGVQPKCAGWRWEHSYAALPQAFYAPGRPAGARSASLVAFNAELAAALGLDVDALNSPHGAQVLSGSTLPEGARPIAQAYAGHQFGNFTMLGDGRAILLGEHITPAGERFDVQLKGAGQTPYSRGGDGRAAVGPMLREYLIGEAMHGLAIPTTRSLAVTTTGETLQRVTPLGGAILTRIAESHLRVGTFEYAAQYDGPDAVKTLADYAIDRHYPELREAEHRYRELWLAVAQRQAELVARWMGIGFVHGVMNTDNVSIAGQTIDYGPCAFIDAYDPATVFSSIDRFGRYAYGNQPAITQWNLARLAEVLIPLFDEDPTQGLAWAREAVDDFSARFRDAWLGVMRRKLGLFDAEPDDDDLVRDLLTSMKEHRADFTNTFRALAHAADDASHVPALLMPSISGWLDRWSQRRAREPHDARASRALMLRSNPAYIPRNHRVEAALAAAVAQEDFTPFDRLLGALANPYEDQPEHDALREPAPTTDPPYRTYCGT